MKATSLLSLIVLIIASCGQRSESDRYADLVRRWRGCEVKLPPGLRDIMTGEDIAVSSPDFTILAYIPESNCNECSMKLGEWKKLL